MELQKIDGIPPKIAARIAPFFTEREWPRMCSNLRSGTAELFRVNGGESYAITRYESDVAELVVCFYEGRDVMQFARVICELAKRNGAETLRYHTRRRGMAKLLSELGSIECETVYRVIF